MKRYKGFTYQIRIEYYENTEEKNYHVHIWHPGSSVNHMLGGFLTPEWAERKAREWIDFEALRRSQD